jgi:hypothetical protein
MAATAVTTQDSTAPTVFQLPITPGTAQTFLTPINGVLYTLRFYFKDTPEAGWTLDISDNSGEPIVCGIPLVTGADMLAQYAYLAFGFKMFMITAGDPPHKPAFADLGAITQVYVQF